MTGFILGIDPGAKGAIALLNDRGDILECDDMPAPDGMVSPVLLADLLDGWLPVAANPMTTAIVERVGAMPGNGSSSMFKFGAAWGIPIGILAERRIRVIGPTPAKWKRDMRLSKDKGASRAMAAERWPADASLFRRVKDDGRAEACLLAAWHLDNHSKGNQ